ncbi:MAG: hypothetical protein ACO1SX_28255 [Actinomycetota bacterium]
MELYAPIEHSRRRWLRVGAVVVALIGLSFGAAAQTPAPAVIRGKIAYPEVSGGALLAGDRLLLVSDNGNGVALIHNALTRLRSGDITPRPEELLEKTLAGKVGLDDLVDVAWDGVQDLFAVTSHSRTRGGDSPETRYRLTRFRFDGAGKLTEAQQSDALLNAIVNGLPFLADAIRRTPARTGLNIEGLAWDPRGPLLLGFRAPTVTESKRREDGGQEDAVVVWLKNPQEVFDHPGKPAVLGEVVKLDLHGGGIRGMAYDPRLKAVWLVSGLSADPNHDVKSPWSLWLWKDGQPPREIKLPANLGLEQPETVTPVELDGKPYLLLIDDGFPASPYALIPAPM